MYPGQVISISIVLVGQLEGTVPGIVTINNDDVYHVSSMSMCTDLSVTVRQWSSYDYNLTLKLEVLNEESFIINGKQFTEGNPYLINVYFKKCPIGFTMNNGSCDCSDTIKSSFKCDINTSSITPIDHGWIGYTSISSDRDEPGLLFHMFCPFDYCSNNGNVSIQSSDTSLDSDAQCSSHHSGLLCGACSLNYSTAIGSTKCLDCRKQSNVFLLLIILLYVLIYLLITVLLFVLNISTTDGTLSGLLFYANILFSRRSLFDLSSVGILAAPIAWLNLDAGFSYCLYDGMDTYAKTCIEFLFPPLMWSVISIMVVLSKKYTRIASLLGNSPIRILATILELSYYRIIEACINALSFTVIEFSSQNHATTYKYVWLRDANVNYLRGKHIPLFIVAAIYSVLVLAYTSVLLFVQPLQRYSHVYCFSWVSRLKPLIDAYTAPNIIKSQCRYWVGLLLLFRIILAIISSFNYSNKPQHNLAAIIIACMLICTIAAVIGGVYHRAVLNFLNISSVINLAFLSLGKELLGHKTTAFGTLKYTSSHSVLICSSVGFALGNMVILASFYIYKRFKKCRDNVQGEPLLRMSDDNFLHSRNQ